MITALDNGYLHQVTAGGRNLSAGQLQLLALARARLVDPDILLLDEATVPWILPPRPWCSGPPSPWQPVGRP